MSTSNFHNANATKIYSVISDDLDDDGFFYDNTKENIQADIFALPNSMSSKRRCFEDLRSYSATNIATLYTQKDFDGMECVLYCTAVMRSGYYEGANLDYTFEDDFDCNLEGESLKLAETWLASEKVRLGEVMESIFKNYSTPLIVSARFSNGETWYSKA